MKKFKTIRIVIPPGLHHAPRSAYDGLTSS
jgi:hypothetical protein